MHYCRLSNDFCDQAIRKLIKIAIATILDGTFAERSFVNLRLPSYITEIFKSCREALAAYPASDLNYWIKPEGTSSAAYGKCYKQVDSTFLFRIMHNSESRLLCNGYERPGSYHRPFFYPQNTVEDLSAVVDALGSCKQRTKMECVHMTLVNYASLIDRKGKDLSYFGGGPQDGKGCACGITGTCHSNRYLCNCDANTYSVLIDEGDVTNQTALPLTGIKLGDTGSSSEYGYHTVGPLECFGKYMPFLYWLSVLAISDSCRMTIIIMVYLMNAIEPM